MSRTFRVYAPDLICSLDFTNCSIENCRKIYGGNPDDPFVQYVELRAEGIGDEYHTMHELYKHRMALNVALFNYIHQTSGWDSFADIGMTWKVIKSKLHHDGTMFDDYFIVMLITEHGQISYHYKLKHWDKFNIPEVERAPPYDGHTSLQVMDRLMKL